MPARLHRTYFQNGDRRWRLLRRGGTPGPLSVFDLDKVDLTLDRYICADDGIVQCIAKQVPGLAFEATLVRMVTDWIALSLTLHSPSR